jgi:DNA-binding GntR family transcriptional regulator
MDLTDIAAPFTTPTLRQNIASLLLEAILSGKLRPGERLNESELARQLVVSRAPIREALRQMEEQGLVVNHPRRGMFVVSLSEADLQKINSLRLVLEAEALRLCRQGATAEAKRKLEQMAVKLERAQPAAMEAARMDFEFHRLLWSNSGNEYLERTLAGLAAPLFAYAAITKTGAEKTRLILDSHRPLVDYVTGNSDCSAEQVMYDHLRLRWVDPGRYHSTAGKPKQTAAAAPRRAVTAAAKPPKTAAGR